jgi:hypothetical protein
VLEKMSPIAKLPGTASSELRCAVCVGQAKALIGLTGVEPATSLPVAERSPLAESLTDWICCMRRRADRRLGSARQCLTLTLLVLVFVGEVGWVAGPGKVGMLRQAL